MQDEVLTQGPHGQDELPKDYQGLSFGQVMALLDEGLKSASLTVLVNQVDVIVSLDHLHKLNHIQVTLQQAQRIDLVPSQLGQFPHLHKLVQRHHLDCHLYPCIHVEGPIDLSVLALAQVVREGVVVDNLDHGSQWLNVILPSYHSSTMIQLALLLALLGLILLVQATNHAEPELPAPDLPPLPPSLRYYLFTEQCYQTLFVQGDFLNIDCLKRAIVKFMGYGIILGGAIVKVPQILKIVNKKSTFGLSYASVFLEASTQLSAVAYNVYRENHFSVYGETLFIAIQCAIILSLFIFYGEANRRTFYILTLIPVAGMFYAAINPAYFPRYIIDNAMIAQIILFSGARLLQIIEIHRVKSTGSLSAITCTMNVLGNLSRLATALVEVADDLLYRASFIVAFLMNGYILLCFFIFRTKSKPEEKRQ